VEALEIRALCLHDLSSASASPLMLTAAPTISVLIAARNCEQTIERAMRSALDQSSRADEVIVVDDMSADQTVNRVLSLVSDRVLLVHGEGRGVSAARNAGIARASGEWIAFLDGDDYWRPEFLQLARLRIREAAGAVACFAAAVPVNDLGQIIGRHDVRELVTLEDLVSGRIVPSTCATLVRRDALLECGGFFEGFRRKAGVEDLDLWWRVAALGACVGVKKPAAVYVVHDGRDRERTVHALKDLESDRELVIDRFAATGAPQALVRRARAIMRARTARYWLRADRPAHARTAARSSLRARPTLEGLVTLAVSCLPRQIRRAIVSVRRRGRARPTGRM